MLGIKIKEEFTILYIVFIISILLLLLLFITFSGTTLAVDGCLELQILGRPQFLDIYLLIN